ncbi:MAG TPA: IS256 family transposase [Caulobacteraceae bacterium]|nr:IS256 family transposase [Caulobacteraceae bacterium]
MPQAVTIASLPRAFELVKGMQAQGLEWGEGYRPLGRQAIAAVLTGQMGQAIDEHLDRMAALDEADRRNGSYRRHLLTELGGIELSVPRTRRFAPIAVLRAYARRAAQLDRMILACFVLGLSVRKVGEALLPILGRLISPATVSTVAKQLDAVVAAFHARPLRERYRVLMLDGVVLARKTGAGAIRRPVLVALGLRPDGKKEVIDFRLAHSESAAEWERFLGDLIRRGLVGEGLEMICVDGGSGLLAALPTAFPGVAIQRCWAHKMRNVLGKVRQADQGAVKADLQAVMNAKTLPQARSAARRFADRWEAEYPKAVACLRDDLDELFTCWRYKSLAERKKVRTTNAIERRFREVRRRTRPMGVFSDRTSMDRILFAVFNHENQNQGISTPLLLTQTF